MIAVKISLVFVGSTVEFRLTYIALVAAAPILIFSRRRIEILKNIDWYTLIFFAAMFVLMKSVWDLGFFQSFIGFNPNITSIPTILATSVIVSQFISNVPFVALYLPLLKYYNVILSQALGIPYAYLFPQVMEFLGGTSTKQLVALAAGSTIAGNLTILGAASNVIVIQNAERSDQTLTFIEFVKVGAPLNPHMHHNLLGLPDHHVATYARTATAPLSRRNLARKRPLQKLSFNPSRATHTCTFSRAPFSLTSLRH